MNYLCGELKHFPWTPARSLGTEKSLCSPIQSFNRTLPTEVDLGSHQANAEEIVEAKPGELATFDSGRGGENRNTSDGCVCCVTGLVCDETSAKPADWTEVRPAKKEKNDAGVHSRCDTERSEFNTFYNNTVSQASSAKGSGLMEQLEALTTRSSALSTHDGQPESLERQVRTNTGTERSSTADESTAHSLISVLGKAVQKRVFNLPRSSTKRHCNVVGEAGSGNPSTRTGRSTGCQDATVTLHQDTPVRPAEVGILFSGGIDSMVLAALADRLVSFPFVYLWRPSMEVARRRNSSV